MKIFKHTILFIFSFLFVCNLQSQVLQTPLEQSGFKSLSTNALLIEFIHKAEKLNPKEIKMQNLGNSALGKQMPYVVISNQSKSKSKVKVMIFGQQHGNEPSGKEGLLLLIKYFATNPNSKLLESTDLYIVPQMNPDGGDKNTRRSGQKIDLNRNHLILTAPETKNLHQLFVKILPEVTLDIHEYYPYDDTTETFDFIRITDETIGTPTNLNVDKEIYNISKNQVLPYVIKNVTDKQFLCGEYLLGTPVLDKSIRRSTVDIDDGRHSFGIQNTFSFILEGKNGIDSIHNIERRAKGQFTAAMALVEFVAANSKMMKKTIKNARTNLINSKYSDSVSIQMDHFKGTANLQTPMYSKSLKKDSVFVTEEFLSEVKSLKNVKRPKAYLVPKSDTLLVQFLNNHAVRYTDCKNVKKENIRRYFIIALQNDTLEGREAILPLVKKENFSGDFRATEYLYVPLNQLASNLLVIAFEPESMLGLATYSDYKYMKVVEKYFPVMRIE